MGNSSIFQRPLTVLLHTLTVCKRLPLGLCRRSAKKSRSNRQTSFTSAGQWRGASIFSLICAWINGWVNNRGDGDLRRHRAHYVIVMYLSIVTHCSPEDDSNAVYPHDESLSYFGIARFVRPYNILLFTTVTNFRLQSIFTDTVNLFCLFHDTGNYSSPLNMHI